MRSLSLKIHILSIALLAAPLAIQAANLVVDNNPANDAADYHDLQEAIDAAAAGDIIYVMPSGTTYGDIDLKSGLTLVGPGFWPHDYWEGMDAFRAATIEDIDIPPGVGDLFLTGLRIDDLLFVGNGYKSIPESELINSNIYIFRNLFEDSGFVISDGLTSNSGSEFVYLQNVCLTNNYFYGTVRLEEGTRGRYSDIKLISNIFMDEVQIHDGGSLSGIVVSNNYFGKHASSQRELYDIARGTCYNNVFYGRSVYVGNFTPSARNNIFIDVNTNTSSESILGADAIFLSNLNEVIQATGPVPNYYSLIENSPALGAGVDGTDIGIFGGDSPWGNNQPPVPIITNLSGPSIVNPGQGLTLTVEAEANN